MFLLYIDTLKGNISFPVSLFKLKKSVDDETDSICETCLVENESIKPYVMKSNSISSDFVTHDHTC